MRNVVIYINLGSFLKIFVALLEESESFSHSVMSDSLLLCPWEPFRLLSPWNSSGKNTGVGCHSLLQGIFLTQGLNLGLLHCRQTLYALSHQGRPTSQIRLGLFFCVKLKRHTLCVNANLKTPVEQNEDPRYRE